ncbi:hypothetical protein MUP77_19025, partial [Candidatus Bathyarchaeota archaeon]|nr:hypothetical protein [Candidatus Bathyarchaeota archaeon]
YARANAASLGKISPPANDHAFLYQVYINQSGFQLFYSGLSNITDENESITIPVQSFIEHYKTPAGKDVLTSSSFIMLMAFNDTTTSLYPNSPDKNDNLYASFSLGLDLNNVLGNNTRPSLSTKTSIIPLTSSNNGLSWKWGMEYSNLTAVWWRMFTDPANPRFESQPIAITTYQELTFTYNLTINPIDHTAKVTANYVIGRMTNLWLIYWLFFIPVVFHYNSTGMYRPNGAKISDQTIYQFLEQQHIKMSVVLFQNSLLLDGTTKSTFNNQNVTDAELDVSKGAISTTAGNEEFYKTDFGTKQQYKLFNYTLDNNEATYQNYNAVTRTAPRAGFAKNPLFSPQVNLLKYVPMIVAHIDPQLYQKAKDHMLNMTYADYFSITSYPTYSGYRIEHDPTYTAFIETVTASSAPTAPYGLIVIGCVVVTAVGGVLVVRGRSPRQRVP